MLPIRSLPRSLPLRQGAFICRQCQRQQTRAASTETPPSPPSASQSRDPSDPRSQILLQQLQQRQQGAIPDYPRAKAEDTRTKSSQTAYDGPFHPAIMGLAAGFMMAAGGMYLQYHFSGRARIVNHFTEVHNRISDDRLRMFVAPARKTPGSVEGTIDERIQWFERCARYYAAYVPGADVYVDMTLPDIEAARRVGGSEMDAKIDTIVRETAQELQNLIKGGEMGLAVGTSAWKIMHTQLELVAESVDQQRDLPSGVRERVQQKIADLVKMGTRIGRSERRAMEDEELKRGVA